MQGRRVHGKQPHELEPGDYVKRGSRWYGATPTGHLGNLSSHEITEHEDGTITASPSILVRVGVATAWHGYLERGVWREA